MYEAEDRGMDDSTWKGVWQLNIEFIAPLPPFVFAT